MTYKRYRQVSLDTITRFESEVLIEGNGTQAIAVIEPGLTSEQQKNRAHYIKRMSEKLEGISYVDRAIEQIATVAVDRVERIVQSPDEQVALRASMFVIDHARGKAVQRTENKNYNLNIQSVLE